LAIMTAAPDTALFVNAATMARLLAQERVLIMNEGGEAHARFRLYDHAFADRPVYVSTLVTENAAHRRVWSGYDRRYVFEHIADV
jgi:hypothetical protein